MLEIYNLSNNKLASSNSLSNSNSNRRSKRKRKISKLKKSKLKLSRHLNTNKRMNSSKISRYQTTKLATIISLQLTKLIVITSTALQITQVKKVQAKRIKLKRTKYKLNNLQPQSFLLLAKPINSQISIIITISQTI